MNQWKRTLVLIALAAPALCNLATAAPGPLVDRAFIADISSIEHQQLIPHVRSLLQQPHIDPGYVDPSPDEIVIALDNQLVVVDRQALQSDISNGFLLLESIEAWSNGNLDATRNGTLAVRLQDISGPVISLQSTTGLGLKQMDLADSSKAFGERVTVIMDGVVIEMWYHNLIGLIKQDVVVVLSGWTTDMIWDVGEVDCERQPYHPLCQPVW